MVERSTGIKVVKTWLNGRPKFITVNMINFLGDNDQTTFQSKLPCQYPNQNTQKNPSFMKVK